MPFLDKYVTSYLDDILIQSDTLNQRQIPIRSVLETFSRAGLHLKLEKCELHKEEVKYLGLIIERGGVKMNFDRVEFVQD